jgi:exodeoxyribonuclease (lambda-induced)
MTLAEKLIQERLAKHAPVFGFDPVNVEQQSYDWFRMRLGVITASQAAKVVMKSNSQTRLSYMAQLVAEIATGEPRENMSNKATEWGNENEPKALETYRFITGRPVDSAPFLLTDDMRCGASPDGLSSDRGIEIKCPLMSENHVMTLCEGNIKKDYQWQVDFSLWVTGLDLWDFGSFDPRMRKNNLHVITVERNDSRMKTLDDAIPQFISELDKMLYSAGFQWGEQWNH